MKKRSILILLTTAAISMTILSGCGDKSPAEVENSLEKVTNPYEKVASKDLVKAVLESEYLLEQITVLGGPDKKPYDGVNQPYDILYKNCPEYKELWDRGNIEEAFLEYGYEPLEKGETSTTPNSLEFQKTAYTAILENFYPDIEIESSVDENKIYHFNISDEWETTDEQ